MPGLWMDYGPTIGLPLTHMANNAPTPITQTLRALARYETPEAAAHASAALSFAIAQMKHGYQVDLAKALGVDRHTIRNWLTRRVPITPQATYRVVEQIAADLPKHPELSRAEVADVLFSKVYEGRKVDAAQWILDLLDSCSTPFPWNELSAVA